MAYLDTLRNESAVMEQVTLAENRARQLTANLEEMKQANEAAEVHIGELSAQRNALALRIDELEKKASLIIAAQPEVLTEALSKWLKTDSRSLAVALTNFLRQAMQ